MIKILCYIDLSNTRIKFSSIWETFFLLHYLMDIWWIEVFNFNSIKIIFLKFFFFLVLVLGKESLPVVMQIFFCIVFHLKFCFVIFHILNFALFGDWGFFCIMWYLEIFLHGSSAVQKFFIKTSSFLPLFLSFSLSFLMCPCICIFASGLCFLPPCLTCLSFGKYHIMY